MTRCHNCGEEWTGEARPGYHATCPACEAYVYVCLNCRFYDPSYASGCQLSTTEPVRRKDHPNFCEEFKLADRPAGWAPGSQQKVGESAREKFGRLFKKP
jgi:hypothetical protein